MSDSTELVHHISRERARITKRIRLRIYIRDRRTCQLCQDRIWRLPWEIDHKVPLSRWGTSDMDNLQLTHKYCNRRKGAAMINAGSMKRLIPLEEAPKEAEALRGRKRRVRRTGTKPTTPLPDVGTQSFVVWGDQPYVAGQMPLG